MGASACAGASSRSTGSRSNTSRYRTAPEALRSAFRKCPACPQQSLPILGRVALLEHGLEHGIGIGLRAIGAQRVAVVDPSEDDDLSGCRIAEEQAEAAISELCPKPVLARRTQRPALAEFGASGIDRDHLEHQFAERCQEFGVGSRRVSTRILLAGAFNRERQLLKLFEKKRMSVKRPSVDRQPFRNGFLLQRATSPSIASSRSTGTSAVSAVMRAANSGPSAFTASG